MTRRAALELEQTGDGALDAILGGGIPKQSVIILAGEPGSGKTVLTHQILFNAARAGKKCLYLTTLAEPAMKVLRYVQQFDFFEPVLMNNIVIRDVGSAMQTSAAEMLTRIDELVTEFEPAFIAIDSFKAVAELLRVDARSGRSSIYDLAVQFTGWGATALLVGEYTREEITQMPEFGIADGIIRLGSIRQELTSVREIEVLKLRGTAHRTGVHFFAIKGTGIHFYPRVSAPDDISDQPSTSTNDQVGTGVAGLDDLLFGGFPRSSTTVLQGGTGTGKTLLGLQFLIEGARQGERGVLFALEETPSQLRSIAAAMHWDLAKLEAEGTLVIKYTAPVELSTDSFLFEARGELQALRAQRAVFDSLTTLALSVPSERRFKEMVYALSKHLRGERVTTLMTLETPQLLGAAQISGDGISFLADNVVQLRYVELGGRLDRAISVLKARGIKHNSELRSFTIDENGFAVVSGKFADLRGVLTGLPSRDGAG